MQSIKVAVIQSNYIPWKGYFDIIHDADLFIFYDDVQYSKNSWRNRNKIKTSQGTSWLTVPVGAKIHRLACEVEITDEKWGEKHWKTLRQCYGKAPHFKHYSDFFEHVYMEKAWPSLSELNQFLIKRIAIDYLGIHTSFHDSREYKVEGSSQERLTDLLLKAGAATYISGPAARDYIDEGQWGLSGIELIYKDYSGYPEYPQLYPPFDHFVSIIDLLFHMGNDAPYYIWEWREKVVTVNNVSTS